MYNIKNEGALHYDQEILEVTLLTQIQIDFDGQTARLFRRARTP